MNRVLDYLFLETLYDNNGVLVYRAEDVNERKTVIIKSIKSARPSLEKLAAFRYEFQINHGLDLETLVHCQKLIEQPDAHMLIYEDGGGITLRAYLKGRALNPDLFFSIALGIIDCISDLHKNKVIHKDIKPDNILIDPDTLKVKLLDLSLASQLLVENQEVVAFNKLEGSLPYMAPEQTGRMNRSVDYRSDYYALGITFYEMLTGSLPFVRSDPLEYVHCHLAVDPKPASKAYPLVPEMLSKITAKLMSKAAEDRYQSIVGLRADVEQCLKQWKTQFKIPEFVLGEQDVLDSLIISSKMYGRDKEVQSLLSAFERIKTGGRECLIISGYSGIGKTTLVNAVQKPIISANGSYVNGKFDQLIRTTPYTAFTNAFSKLIQLWLIEAEEKLKLRKDKILQALGQSGQVMVDFLPELELVLGKQPEVESLPPEQAQNRFLLLFQKFVSCIATSEEPLVIFIDDLQWIDQGSLKLLELIMTSENVSSLFFIGAYRDNEVDETHPFLKLLAKLKQVGVPVEDIKLAPLRLVETKQLLSDTLNMDVKTITPLAEIIVEKTGGNPFFIREFLKECYTQEFLVFLHKDLLWHWDIQKITNLPGSNNVVDLMVTKLNRLTKSDQRILQLGACVGMNFDGEILSLILGLTELEIIDGLSSSLKEGFIQRINNGLTYKFIHDRIQQASYETISNKEKRQLHLKVGRFLFKKIDKNKFSEQLFDVLDQYKRCIDLLADTEEKEKVAELCILASKQASGSGAFDASYGYLSMGIALTCNFDWERNYSLLWRLNLNFLECLYLRREFQKALELIAFLLIKAHSNLDKAYVIRIHMMINLVLNKHEENLSLHCQGSALLGHEIPYKPSKNVYEQVYAKFRHKYGRGVKFANRILSFNRSNDEKLVLLNEIHSLGGLAAQLIPEFITQGQVMVILCVPYYELQGAPNNMIFQILEANSRYIFMKNGDLKEYDVIFNAAYLFLKNNSFKSEDKAYYLVRLMRFGGFFLKIRDMISLNEFAFQSLLETGSFSVLILAIHADYELSGFSDLDLKEMHAKSNSYLKLGSKLQIESILVSSRFSKLSCQHLLGEDNVSINDLIESLPPAPTFFGFFIVFNCYLIEDFVKAKELAEKCFNETKWYNQSITPRIYSAILILILVQLYPQASSEEKKIYMKDIDSHIKKLAKFASHNPDNFLHLYLIGQAEHARLKNEILKAINFYLQSIEAAKAQGFNRWVAIANEHLGKLYLGLQDMVSAASYFHEAIYYYQRWGCVLKVNALKNKYAHLLAQRQLSYNQGDSETGFSTTFMTGELDLLTMTKANQAISSEIRLDKLLPRILEIVIESAGADKAAFIGLQGESRVIEAQASMIDDVLCVNTQPSVLSESSPLAEGVITYTIRSGMAEVVDDMMNNERYAKLPYVLEQKPKSILCLPIVRDKKIIALLYLENKLTTRAFTPDRVHLLQSLSTQIAISLENARYLERTQNLFHATERFVPKKFLQLLGRNNIEEVQIGDSAKVEMSAIFADLRDFTTISESIEPEELTYILNTYLKYMAPIIRNNNGFINRVLGDGILALFPNETQDAVQAAIEMQQALLLFNKEINKAGFKSIFMGIGVNTGPAMLCALGEEERIEANVVSDMVNSASRIEGLNKMYGTQLLISDATFNKLSDASRFCIRMVDTIRVKGKTKAMGVYEVLPVNSYAEQKKIAEYIVKFEKAITLYKEGNFEIAKKAFETCLLLRTDDPVANLFKNRCEQFIQEKPKENWDGITTMLEK